MKRKNPDNNKEASEKSSSLPNKSVRSYSNQRYAIHDLKKNKLKLWPIKIDDYLATQKLGDKPIKVSLETATDKENFDEIELYKIKGFNHGGLEFCQNELSKSTTVGDLKRRLKDVRARAVEIDRVTVGVAAIMIPLCEEMIVGDIFQNEGSNITMIYDTHDRVEIAINANTDKEYLPGEIDWLTGIYGKLLKTQTKIKAFCDHSGIVKIHISFRYFRERRGSQVIILRVSATKETYEDRWRHKRERAETVFIITKETEAESFKWEFYRDVYPSSVLALRLTGQTDWIQGFPPLKPNFTAVPIEIDDTGWPEPTTDLEVWQRSNYNPKWNPSFAFETSKDALKATWEDCDKMFYNTSSDDEEEDGDK